MQEMFGSAMRERCRIALEVERNMGELVSSLRAMIVDEIRAHPLPDTSLNYLSSLSITVRTSLVHK